MTLHYNLPADLADLYRSLNGTKVNLKCRVCKWKSMLCVRFLEDYVAKGHTVISTEVETYHISVSEWYDFSGIKEVNETRNW